jgi:WD40 repeat protein
LAAFSSGRIRFWDTTTWKERPPIVHKRGYMFAMTLSPDGKALFTGGAEDNAFRMWDPGTGLEVRRFNDKQMSQIHSVAVSADGKLAGHPQAINALVFSRTGRFLISGSDDGSAVVWDLNQVRGDR